MIYISVAGVIFSEMPCSEPSSDYLQKRFAKLNNGIDIRSFLIPHAWTDLEIEFDHIFTITNTHAISKQCPSTHVKGNYPLMFRTSCPWYLASELNDSRYPRVIEYAKSSCKTCIGSDGTQGCERIHHKIKILRKTECKNNVYEYEEEDFLLPTGYVCAQAKEVEDSNPIDLPPSDFPMPI